MNPINHLLFAETNTPTQLILISDTFRERKELLEELRLRKTDRMERLLSLMAFLNIIQQSTEQRVLESQSAFLDTDGVSQTKGRRDSVLHINNFMKKHCPTRKSIYRIRESFKAKLRNFSMAFGAILGGKINPDQKRLRLIARTRRNGMYLSEGFQKKHIQLQYWNLLRNGEVNEEVKVPLDASQVHPLGSKKRFDFKHLGNLQRRESFAQLTAAVKDMRTAFNILTRSRFVLGLDSLGQVVYYKSHFRDQIDSLLDTPHLAKQKLVAGYYKLIRLEKSRTIDEEDHNSKAMQPPLRRAKTIKEQNRVRLNDGVFWRVNLEAKHSQGMCRLGVMDTMLKKVYKDVAREKIFEFNFRQLKKQIA